MEKTPADAMKSSKPEYGDHDLHLLNTHSIMYASMRAYETALVQSENISSDSNQVAAAGQDLYQALKRQHELQKASLKVPIMEFKSLTTAELALKLWGLSDWVNELMQIQIEGNSYGRLVSSALKVTFAAPVLEHLYALSSSDDDEEFFFESNFPLIYQTLKAAIVEAAKEMGIDKSGLSVTTLMRNSLRRIHQSRKPLEDTEEKTLVQEGSENFQTTEAAHFAQSVPEADCPVGEENKSSLEPPEKRARVSPPEHRQGPDKEHCPIM